MKIKGTAIAVAICLTVAAGAACASVLSTKHDLRQLVASVEGTGGKVTDATTEQACVFCHHPHRGEPTDGAVSTLLLWNISDSNSLYSTYTSPTANSAADIGGNVGTDFNSQYTLLCMGCHDGDVADNSFVRDTLEEGRTIGTFGTLSFSAEANIGFTLQDDHPVDFTYPVTIADNDDLRVSGSGEYVLGVVTGTMYPLFGGTMQCATCHDVHNGQSPTLQFMRGDQDIIANSYICRDCHMSK